jgi:methyl-accepting chemotaxis protein
MKWSVGAKMGSTFTVVWLLLLGIGTISYRGTVRLIETAGSVSHDNQVRFEISDLLSQTESAETYQRGYLLTGEGVYLEPYNAATAGAKEDLAGLRRLTADDPNQQRRLDSLDSLVPQRFVVLESVIALRRAKGFEPARKAILSGQGKDIMDRIRGLVQEMDRQESGSLRVRDSEARATVQSTKVSILAGTFIALVASLLGAFVLTRNIAGPLGTISETAERIAAGNLNVSLPSSNRSDEVGVLTRSFGRMTESLGMMAGVARRISAGDLSADVKPQSEQDVLGNAFAAMVKGLREIAGVAKKISRGDLSADVKPQSDQDVLGNAFRLMVEGLREMAGMAQKISGGDLTVEVKLQSDQDVLGTAFQAMVKGLRELTREIREGVTVLASSASEILATTAQVAAGASETATAVSQTTSTVEEVKQTAQMASEKARYVSETAQKSAQVSQTGKKSVEETIAVMNRISEQMDLVAGGIVRLSEQGQAIGEIMASVNDLAEQSNLLAVNASIEAAKAGEHGKGFAVVAQEVRSLAQQSKQATAQVRTILSDFQKATSAAVMATEQGSKAVDSGVKQSVDASEAIRMLADSISESAKAAAQIAASSQQQRVGMDQVALAMESIKQASLQNVSSTKQGEAAAQNLHTLGQRMKQLVEQYRV